MKKCLVTKLNGSSDNSELMRVGEMRMKISKVTAPTNDTQGFTITVNKPITLEIIGEGYFTDITLTENKGKTLTLNTGNNGIWVNNDDVEIAILDKYSLSSISIRSQGGKADYGKNKHFNIADFKYSSSLTSLHLDDTQTSGDIANLKNLTALINLHLSDTQVSGDIANLKNLTALIYLYLNSAQCSGDIGVFSVMKNITNISIKFGTYTGDLSKIPDNCSFISFLMNTNTVLSWTNRPSTAYILAIEGNAKITDVDKMLQNQAQCQVGFTESSTIWYKRIQCVGTRTSASDEAVATLQSKGYTVSITPA